MRSLILANIAASVVIGACLTACPSEPPGLPSPSGSGGIWEPRALMPAPRQETAVVTLGDEVVVLGGILIDLEIVDTVEAYSLDDDSWRSLPPLPMRMHHVNAAVVDDKIIVAGALTGFDFAGNQTVVVFDPVTDTWEPRAAMPPGTERGGAGVAVLDDAVYVVGGYSSGSARSEFSRYLVDEDRWEELPRLPQLRDHVLAFASDNRIFVVGGRQGAISSHTAQTLTFDVDTNEWTEVAPMPTSRAGAAGALCCDGRFYVVGGEGDASNAAGVFVQTEAYDPQRDSWERLAPMRTPRHGMGASCVGNTLVVPGGAEVEAFGASAVVEIFLPPL